MYICFIGLESVHLYGKGKIEMVKKISFIELIFSIWLTLILLAIMLLWLNPIPYSHVFAIDGEYRASILSSLFYLK